MKNDVLNLRHILDAIDKVEAYTAVGVDLPAVWEITQNELPVFTTRVQRIMNEPASGP